MHDTVAILWIWNRDSGNYSGPYRICHQGCNLWELAEDLGALGGASIALESRLSRVLRRVRKPEASFLYVLVPKPYNPI